MNATQAKAIAILLNEQNQLDGEYDADRVMQSAGQYRFRIDKQTGGVTAAVQIKQVQWYQHEVLHLTVAPAHWRNGLGKKLLAEVEDVAKRNRARILQCTIRDDNNKAKTFFHAAGFSHTVTFHNCRTGNNVTAWQKVLIPEKQSPNMELKPRFLKRQPWSLLKYFIG